MMRRFKDKSFARFARRVRIIFYDGFAKSALDNIKDNELMLYKRAAKYLVGLTDEQLDAFVAQGRLLEF